MCSELPVKRKLTYFFRTSPETARIRMTNRQSSLSCDCKSAIFDVRWLLTVYGPVVILYITRFNIQKLYILSTQCPYVFVMDPSTNSDSFLTQHCEWFLQPTRIMIKTLYKPNIYMKFRLILFLKALM